MKNSTLSRRLAALVQNDPQAGALICKGQILTRENLLSLADQIAGALPVHARIGLVMDHKPEMIAALFGILKNGSTYIPAEPSFPKGRIKRMMEEASVSAILTQKKYASLLTGFPLVFVEDLNLDPERKSEERPDLSRPEDLAYILYTSGTTGIPKGVCVTNANVCHYVDAFNREFHVSPADRMLQYSVCSFDIFTEEVFASLLNGGMLVLPQMKDKKSAQDLMKFVEANGITMISGFPYLLEKINELPAIPSSLRLLISGGDVLRENYVSHLYDKVAVYNTYGPSETTVCASYFHCVPGSALNDGTFPVGKPVLDVQIELLDENGKLVKPGATGEIVIYGKGVSNGYLKDHGHENDAFETLPDGTRRYWSGDLGQLLGDGNLAFLHRKDSQVMIYGRRVEIEEVESALNQCKGISMAVVRDFLDEEDLPYLCAYIVTSPAFQGLHQLKRELAYQLPAFMIPKYFVSMKDIVLNANGKPDRNALPQVLDDGEISWS